MVSAVCYLGNWANGTRPGSDPNRQRLLDVGYTDAVLGILKAYWRTAGQPSERGEAPTPADNVTLSDLKLVKTAVGVLLNASMGFGAFGTQDNITCWADCLP